MTKQVFRNPNYSGQRFFYNFICELKDTLCENVLSGNRVCVHSSHVMHKFPKGKLLKDEIFKLLVSERILELGKKL